MSDRWLKLLIGGAIIGCLLFLSPGPSSFSSPLPLSRVDHGQGQAQGPSQNAANTCVSCHVTLTEPLSLSHRHLEWQLSKHRVEAVTCEKCHGGDPSTMEMAKAHRGVRKASDPESTLAPQRQPATCATCHSAQAALFTESLHFEVLRRSGLGPSCYTCHQHMATKVVYSPEETASMCANCHDTIGGLLPPRPEIPAQARETMQALQRADLMRQWVDWLLADARRRGLSLEDELPELRLAQAALSDAKLSWHRFDLAPVRRQADDAFTRFALSRQRLERKLAD
jgi:hypothetical protein